ncbi:MAG: peptidogalycan biosysnthesis protein, partial [Pseudomonadota bacterium]|nr:peptidogalycan biosysnthesis protein [Pseudomonadota bacterium]
MHVAFYDSIEKIGRSTWQGICGTDYPFLRYEFLFSLERAGSDGPQGSACNVQSGWQPQHGIVFDDDRPIAAFPMYLKYHSYGEYIF